MNLRELASKNPPAHAYLKKYGTLSTTSQKLFGTPLKAEKDILNAHNYSVKLPNAKPELAALRAEKPSPRHTAFAVGAF